MRKRILIGVVAAVLSASTALASYTHIDTFSVHKVAATDRGFTWLVREKTRTMVLFDLDGYNADAGSRSGEPSMGGGILYTESEHTESYITFRDSLGRTYIVQGMGTCDDYPFTVSEICEW